jgi:hypothetical protein
MKKLKGVSKRTARQPRCPNPACKSTSIGQLDRIPGVALIDTVEPDGTINWAGATIVLWDDQKPASDPAEWACAKCGKQGPRTLFLP